MFRMKDERLPKTADTKNQGSFRKRRTPRLAWTGLPEDRSKKVGGRRKMERNGQQQGAMMMMTWRFAP